MKKHLAIGLAALLLACITGSDANAANAQIRITADNFYTLYFNGTEIGGNWDGIRGDSSPLNWGTPETFTGPSLQLNSINTVLVKATNAGFYGADNPGGLIARIQNQDTGEDLAVTNADWSYSTDYNEVTQIGTWNTPAYVWSSWNSGKWSTVSGYTQPGGTLYNAFYPCHAQWIWGQPLYASPVWFRINIAIEEPVADPAVPEPMSVMLGIMGLGSIAGFKKLRKF